MVSKNNQYWKQQRDAQRVPHYGLRKLSIGVASVLLSTTLYMSVTAHADTVTTPSEQPAVSQQTNAATGTSTGSITVDAQSTADKTASTATNNATPENDASAKPVQTVSPEQPANATDAQPIETTNVAQPTKNSNVELGNNESAAKSTGQSVDSSALMTNFAVTEQPTDGTHNSDTTTLNTTFKWAIHYTDEAGKKLLPDSVITHDYTRTDTGNQMGNWSYVPNSVKVTGTPNVGYNIDNPNFKFDQNAGGTVFDYSTWQAVAASIKDYTPNYPSVAITDQLPKNPEGLHATTIVDSGKHEFTFVYTQQPKTVKINYVNDDDNEAVVKTDNVSGKLNTAVTITPNLPSGYMLTPGKDVPNTYTVTDADNQAVTIHVQKQFVDVSDTDPQAKQTRTITLHYVYAGGSKDVQKAFDDAVLDVYYHRTATLDRTTNQTTYGDWAWDKSQGDTSTPGYHVVSGKWTNLPQSWANVTADVPSIKGYYADLGQNDPANTNHVPANAWVFPAYNNGLGEGILDSNKGATAYLDGHGYEVSPTHTIKYVPNKTTVTVNYVDDDNNKVNVGSQHWDGTIGQHINLTLTPPANYVLSPGWGNPSSYDFDGVNSAWYTVHVKHATQDVTDQQSKDQISKTETLTRKHLYGQGPHEGEQFGDSDIVEVPWHRTATKDLVTNKVTFGDWHVVWDKVKQLSGATKISANSEHNWISGSLIAGRNGYSYLGIGAKTEAISTDDTVSMHGFYWNNESDIEKNPTIVQYYGRYEVSVPVNYVDFDTNQQLATKQLTGDDYLDGNTITINKGDLTDWGTSINKKYQLYAGQTLPTTYKIDTVSNDGNLTPITVYVVQPRTVQFTFADNDSTVNGQHPQVGDAISVTCITGSTTSVNLTIPAGYKLADGQQLPTTYTFVKGGQNQVILLTHQHTTVQPDAPKTPSDKLPDNPDKSYPSGVAKDDLIKTVTRKVTIVTPDGKSTVANQTVTFTRNATVDEVTGKVTYGSWSENGKHEFATVDVLNVPGYTATGDVPSLTVTPDSKDTTVTIGYTANKQQVNINYVDINDGNKVVHTTTVNGVTDGDTNVPNELPVGYKLVDGQSVPKTVHFNANNDNDINVKVQHSTVMVTPDSPKTPSDKLPDNPSKSYPSGVAKDDLSKTVTRKVTITTPDGKQTVTNQAVTFTRNATVDEVTGHVTYGSWSENGKHTFTTVNAPTVAGYAANGNVPSLTVTPNSKDTTVNISYTANKQQVNINYIDINDGNKVVHTTNVNGVTDGDSVVPNELPTGYKLVDGQSIPKTIHFNANNNNDINIKVQHTTVTVTPDLPKTPSDKLPDNPDKSYPSGVSENDLNKTITRTIKVTTPDGQTKMIAQTVKLTRTATVDEVTGEVTYGKWSTGQWGAYDVPAVPGYIASQPSVEITPVNENTKDQTVDVSYTPNKQSTVVKYVDDKGQVVHTTTVNGATDQTVKVSSEVPAGWIITNGQVPSEITFGADGHEPIEVTVAHQHVTVNPDYPQNNGTKLPDNPAKTFNGVEVNDLNKTITRTIKVTTPDGQTKTVEQTVHLTRTADVDEVTGEVTYGNWTTGEWSNYDVPMVQGYTASQNEVPTAKVTGDTKDQTVTVTYTADQQKLIVNFIDDITGQTLKTVNKDGLTNSDSNYNTKSDIQDYVNNHYHLVSDDTNGQSLVFDNDDSKTQTYNVHLAHNTHDINDSNTVTETIHYKLDNGQKAFDDYNAQLNFTRTGYNDEVTGQNHWNDWQATNGQTFNAVQSPSKEGYTPDKTFVEAINVKPGDKNIDTTVTYNANAQAAKISYIDDTTGRTVKIDNANGKFNQAINFDNNVDNQIKDYEQQGYVLKSNNFSNQTYQTDNAKNVFEVHLVHGTKNVQHTQKITETVQYQMEDGTKAPVTNSQSVDFTQDGVQDLVTNNIDWKATAPQQFKEVITPVMTGYTPDITSVPVTTANFGDKDINKVITYKANAQTAKISYIDDNTGAALKTDNVNGKFNQAISFGDVDGAIKGFEDKGYQLKSNSFQGQKYQADNNSNVFEVHLVHGTKNVQRTQKITETINYQMDDGSKAPAANTQSVDFTQDGVQDLVTNNIDWKATEPQQFKVVDMPTVNGYTPDITSVPTTTINFGDKDINKLVTYKANAQSATINYIDDTTGKTIKTDNANGKFNQPISFDNNVDNQIKAFENQGYFLKSNSFNGQKYQADNNSNVFKVHLVHGTKNVQRTQKITEIVNYQMDDGSQAPSTNTQSVNFTQNGVQDLVTNNIDWKATEPQQFKAVDSPAVTGYTPDIASVPVTTVSFGDKDINKTVTYKANTQSAKITYIDDNTGKTLKVDDANGKFNQVIDFANMNSNIKDFENQGYALKSNSFNGQKYQADNTKNTFEVHFTHGTKNVQRQDTITETVKYQYDNGTPAHENNVQTLNFTQDGVQDLVTKNIDWKPTDAQEFKQVDTPTIDSYTPDITSIFATKVNFGDSDINKVVTYQANNQTANIHYVDDMTGSFIGNDTANGKFDTVIDFGNVNDKINAFKNLGYQLVSNDFSGQTYQSDNSKNVYYVHFTHGIKNIQRNKQITETIKYQYENGQQARPDSVQTVSFNENGSQDLVTKKINWFNDAPQQFKAVNTPVITGYTADIDNIPAVVVNYDNDNINKVVTYKANSQTAKINYIDDTTGKVIKTDTANGKFNQAISFSETPVNVVNDLIKRGYKLVSNSFNGQTYQNDNSKNEFTVHLAHNTKNVSKQNTVTRTINYLDNDGKAIQAPTVETVTFTQDGITDLVTGNTTWNAPSSQTFEAVTSPTIKEFGKPNVEVVKPQTVNFNDQNVVVNVHYPKATTPTNVNNNTTTPTVDHNKGKLNPTTFTTITHQTTPQAHTVNNGGQQSITPQSVNKPSEQQTVANNGTKANTLPQTGNSDDNSTAIVGLGLLSGMLGLLGIKGKKKQN